MINLTINGQEKNWDGDPDLSLLWFLRDEAGLTGTKFGCGQALCGSCTVIVDKEAVRSCITSVSDVVTREVTTIEGLTPRATTRFRKPGARAMSRNAVIARPDRSCRRRRFFWTIQSPPTIRYARPCRAISAAAAVISGLKTRSISLRRGSDHEHHHTPE